MQHCAHASSFVLNSHPLQEPVIKAQLESTQKQLAATQEQLGVALKENHILKRAVAIQHERHREHESQAQELQSLKQSVAQYQEQLRKLEVSLHASMSCNSKL